MSISREEVEHVARLARLHLTARELEVFEAELNAQLDHFRDLDRVDVSDAPEMPRAVGMENVWQADEPRAGLDREDALANAPRTRAGLFIVPSILED